MNIRKINSEKFFPLCLLFLQLILLAITFGGSMGSEGDWMTQHTTIPDYFRKLFYQTGSIAPDLTMGLGGGQNIFSYAYYGLFSPVFFLSYLLPFVPMSLYVQVVSVLIYLVSGYLAYRWLRHRFDAFIAFCGAAAFSLLPPFLYHAHHHIMFVWYMPFLFLALMGVDRFVEQKKFVLLALSVSCIILTNYMYSPSALIGLYIYCIFRLLEEKPFRISRLFSSTVPFIVGMMISAILLVPTALVILGGRISDAAEISFSLRELILPASWELFHAPFSAGLSCFLLFGIFTTLFSRKKQEWIFALILLVLTLSPFLLLLLNGGIYIRGKVLLPLAPLYILCFCFMLEKYKEGKKHFLALGALSLCLVYFYRECTLTMYFIPDLIITTAVFAVYYLLRAYKKNFWQLIAFAAILIIATSNIRVQATDKYIAGSVFDTLSSSNDAIESLAEKTANNDSGFYRSTSLINRHNTINVTYADNWFGTSVYSSTANSYYLYFYNEIAGNNIQHRNDYIDVAAVNPLFNSFMGVKYVYASKSTDSLYYEKLDENDQCALFENKLALPLIYTSNTSFSEEAFLSLSYPDTIRALFGTITVDGEKNNTPHLAGDLTEISVSALKKQYAFRVSEKSKTMTIPLDTPITNQFILVRLQINYNPNYDINIAINGVNNRLSARSWRYHNHNDTFEYTLSSKEPITELVFSFTEGFYNFSDIHVYTLDLSPENIPFCAAEITDFDTKNSQIAAKTMSKTDTYMATTLPYDKGYRIYIDGEETALLRVNTAFVGCKIPSGEHEVLITYDAPGFTLGKWISLLGLLLLIAGVLIDHKKRKLKNAVQIQSGTHKNGSSSEII